VTGTGAAAAIDIHRMQGRGWRSVKTHGGYRRRGEANVRDPVIFRTVKMQRVTSVNKHRIIA
jgi:hypothetical protein